VAPRSDGIFPSVIDRQFRTPPLEDKHPRCNSGSALSPPAPGERGCARLKCWSTTFARVDSIQDTLQCEACISPLFVRCRHAVLWQVHATTFSIHISILLLHSVPVHSVVSRHRRLLSAAGPKIVGRSSERLDNGTVGIFVGVKTCLPRWDMLIATK
jgi:hypothetical protein